MWSLKLTGNHKTLKIAPTKSRGTRVRIPTASREWIIDQAKKFGGDQTRIPPTTWFDAILQEGVQLGKLTTNHNPEGLRSVVRRLLEQQSEDAD